MKWILAVSRRNFLPDGGQILHRSLETMGATPSGILIHDNASVGMAFKAVMAWSAGARVCAGSLIRSLVRDRASPWESARGIPRCLAKDLNSPEALRFVRELRPDLGIHVRTRCILRAEMLSLPPLGWVNIHHGLLPRDRGTSCDLYELREGRPAGFSMHRMTNRVDSGDILATRVVDDGSSRDYPEYLVRSSRLEADSIQRLLEQVMRTGNLPEGIANTCDHPEWSRTPGWRTLRHMVRREGFRL